MLLKRGKIQEYGGKNSMIRVNKFLSRNSYTHFIVVILFFILLVPQCVAADSPIPVKQIKPLFTITGSKASPLSLPSDVSVDEDGNIVSWNSGAEFIFGYAESEALGEPVTLIMPERYRDMHRDGMQRYKQTGVSKIIDTTMELHGLRKDATEIDIRFSLSTWDLDDEPHFCAIIHEITETNKLECQLEAMASKDGLTGLYNRATFDIRIIEELSRAKRYKQPISLMFLDIDYFNKVNDNYGHAAGDQVLKLVATILNKNMRETDFIARYDGEEFVSILPGTDINGAQLITDKLRELIESSNFHFREEAVNVTVSSGFAEIKENEEGEALFVRADKALYDAKAAGRDKTVPR